jgi:hypothetical protein
MGRQKNEGNFVTGWPTLVETPMMMIEIMLTSG